MSKSDAYPTSPSSTVPSPSSRPGLSDQHGRGWRASPNPSGNPRPPQGTDGTRNGSGSCDDETSRNLRKILAQLPSSPRLDFANRYLEVRDVICISFVRVRRKTVLWSWIACSVQSVYGTFTANSFHAAPFMHHSQSIVPTVSSASGLQYRLPLRLASQEFRVLSASWDSTKHLSMGKMVLHASLSGLLRNLAHDEPAKQVCCCMLRCSAASLALTFKNSKLELQP